MLAAGPEGGYSPGVGPFGGRVGWCGWGWSGVVLSWGRSVGVVSGGVWGGALAWWPSFAALANGVAFWRNCSLSSGFLAAYVGRWGR